MRRPPSAVSQNTLDMRHHRESGGPFYSVTPAEAGVQTPMDSRFRGNDRRTNWIPAYAGMTTLICVTALAWAQPWGAKTYGILLLSRRERAMESIHSRRAEGGGRKENSRRSRL